MTSARGIAFDYRPSATLTALGSGILVLAAAAPLFTALPWFLRWPLAALVGMGGGWRLQAFRCPPVTACVLSSAGLWTVTLRTRRQVPAELSSARRFGEALFLRLRWKGGAGQVALLPDNTPAETLRLLRARL
jgi:hypothetical protein